MKLSKGIVDVFLFISSLLIVNKIMYFIKHKNAIYENVYQFEFTSLDGLPIRLADYKDKVILVVNTASRCGFASQYQQLQALHDRYHTKGLVIVGVSSSDFYQEYTDVCQIKTLTQAKLSLSFLLTVPTKVRGKKAHPFYQWANNQVGFLGSPKWNFHKYLISRDGRLIHWFSSIRSPKSKKIINAIENALSH